MENNQMQNKRGEWVPSIPEPFYARSHRYQCGCGKATFWTKAGYQGHYAYAHILGMSPWNANYIKGQPPQKGSE